MAGCKIQVQLDLLRGQLTCSPLLDARAGDCQTPLAALSPPRLAGPGSQHMPAGLQPLPDNASLSCESVPLGIDSLFRVVFQQTLLWHL